MDAETIGQQAKHTERPPEVLSFNIRRDEFCRKLGNGLPRGSITLIEGEDGSGKSLISQRVVYGLLENGFSVTYISTDLSTKDFITQMQSLKYDIVKYLLNRKLLFIPVFPITKKLNRPTELLGRMMSAPHLFENQVIVIDCLTVMTESGTMGPQNRFEFSSFMRKLSIGFQDILADTIGGDNAWGTCTGVVKEGPATLARLTTDDAEGEICGYVAEGDIDREDPKTFGGAGILRVPDLQDLLHHICMHGYEHHVAMSMSETGMAVAEAWDTYMGWNVYLHNA